MNNNNANITMPRRRHSPPRCTPEICQPHAVLPKHTLCKVIRKRICEISTNIKLLLIVIFILLTSTATLSQYANASSLDPDDTPTPAPQQSTIKHPFLLIDRGLFEKNIDLLSITDGRLRFSSRLIPNASIPLNDILILLRIDNQISQTPPPSTSPSSDTRNQNSNTLLTPDQPVSQTSAHNKKWTGPTIRLTDGRILTGQFKKVIEDGAALLWRNDLIGEVRIPTENISRIYFRSKSSATNQSKSTADDQTTGDTVELTNGDRMVGFIAFPDSKRISIETNRDAITLDMNRISSITLENEPVPPPYNACRVFLDDGSIFDIDQSKLHTRGQGVRIVPANFTIINATRSAPDIDKSKTNDRWANFNSLRAIVFNAGSIQPLASLMQNPQSNNSDSAYESTQWFESTIPPEIISNNNQPISLNNMRFEGPAQFHYPIPARASRFAAGAIVPRAALAWADFNLVILADDRELYRKQFKVNNPDDEIIINLPQPATSLTIQIEENNRGPILEIITLRHPLFLLDKP